MHRRAEVAQSRSRCLVEKGGQAVYSKELVENLVSVGKLCDEGKAVVFDKGSVRVFEGEIKVEGEKMLEEKREIRTGLYPIRVSVSGTGAKREEKGWMTKGDSSSDQRKVIYKGYLARFYVKEGMTDYERWHNKLGHVGAKQVKLCNIPNLKIPVNPFRCTHCIHGKMHTGNHSTTSLNRETDLRPGEYILTDLQGPYVCNARGEKYLQLFLDVKSRRVWTARLRKKAHAIEEIRRVIDDVEARSGRKVRVVRTDGDGMFSKSTEFLALKQSKGFTHERAAYDHNQNALIDRECRTVLESVSTSLIQSGAPSTLWGEASEHFVFTRNNIPRRKEGEEYKTPESVLCGREIKFNIKHLVAFGTQVTCFIPEDRREGSKTPGKYKSYDGVVIGYGTDMQAYVVWDIKHRKKRDVSFFHCVVHEGYFPLQDKGNWGESGEVPKYFSPRWEDIKTPADLKVYQFIDEEEKEILERFLGEKLATVELAARGEQAPQPSPHYSQNSISSNSSDSKSDESDVKESEVRRPAVRMGPRYHVPHVVYAAEHEEVPGVGEAVPKTIGEARKSKYWLGFRKAIDSEMRQLEKNNTWEYVDRGKVPRGCNILRSKLVFDIKRGSKGEFVKYKARFVACGYNLDYFDTYASVMNGKSFRILLALYNSSEEYSMQHWDVKQAFVNAPIEETVYVHQIKGCEKEGEERSVLRLKKALYGTKQAAAAWQKHLAQILVSEGGRRNLKDECVFIFNECGGVCVIGTQRDIKDIATTIYQKFNS